MLAVKSKIGEILFEQTCERVPVYEPTVYFVKHTVWVGMKSSIITRISNTMKMFCTPVGQNSRYDMVQ